MKALTYFGPNDIRIVEVKNPKVNRDDILIKVKATGICGSDYHGYLGITGRKIPPMIMGHEFSGVVSKMGSNVKNYKIGDRVTVQPIIFCGECEFCAEGLTNICPNRKTLGVMDVNGSMAEYISVPQKNVYKLPDSISFLQATLIEPLAVSYSAVKKVDIKGENIFIAGAGAIGLLILQIIKSSEPEKVFISDLSDHRLCLAKKIGADFTINPNHINLEDFVFKETNRHGVDLSFEAVGTTPTVEQSMIILKNGGISVWVGNSDKTINLDMQNVVTRELKIIGTYTYTHKEFGNTIKLLSEVPLDINSLISKVVTLDEGPDAFKQLGEGDLDLIRVIITD